MQTMTRPKTLSMLSVGTIALLGLAACSDANDDTADMPMEDGMSTEESMSPDSAESTDMMDDSEMTDDSDMAEEDEDMDMEADMDPMSELVGSACMTYDEQWPEGEGSFEWMAEQPVADAAASNPMLTMLTSAVSGGVNPDVDLVDMLNSGEYTILAPVDEAFEQVPEEDLAMLMEDSEALTDLLSYHVIEGRWSPDELMGEPETVNGEMVTITGEGEEMMFDEAGLVCGGVMTENATVYMIDGVLMPSADASMDD